MQQQASRVKGCLSLTNEEGFGLAKGQGEKFCICTSVVYWGEKKKRWEETGSDQNTKVYV